jgi:hypothetical protein
MAGRNCTSSGSSSFGSLDSVAGSFQDFSAKFITKNITGAVFRNYTATIRFNTSKADKVSQ